MTNDDLANIEAALGVTLPSEYRVVMTDNRSADADFWYGGMFNNPQVIIDRTLDFRGLTASYDQPCASTCVVVSEVNGGDTAFLDTAKPETGLWLYDHETMKSGAVMGTVTNFVESTLRVISESETKRRAE